VKNSCNVKSYLMQSFRWVWTIANFMCVRNGELLDRCCWQISGCVIKNDRMQNVFV